MDDIDEENLNSSTSSDELYQDESYIFELDSDEYDSDEFSENITADEVTESSIGGETSSDILSKTAENTFDTSLIDLNRTRRLSITEQGSKNNIFSLKYILIRFYPIIYQMNT